MNFGDGLLEPSISGLTANSVGPTMQGKVQGGAQSIQSVSRVLGPLFGAWIYGYFRGLPYISSIFFFGIALIVFVTAIPAIKSHKVANA